MHIIRREAGYARHTYIVLLDEQDVELTDQQLVNMADAGGDYAMRDTCSNFGGFAARRPGRRTGRVYAQIVVHID